MNKQHRSDLESGVNSALKAVFAQFKCCRLAKGKWSTLKTRYCNKKAKNLNARYQEPLAREAPAGNAHSPTMHKHHVIQLMACSFKQATIRPFVCFQKFILTTVSSKSGTTWNTSDLISKQLSALLFSTVQLFALWFCSYKCHKTPSLYCRMETSEEMHSMGSWMLLRT